MRHSLSLGKSVGSTRVRVFVCWDRRVRKVMCFVGGEVSDDCLIY